MSAMHSQDTLNWSPVSQRWTRKSTQVQVFAIRRVHMLFLYPDGKAARIKRRRNQAEAITTLSGHVIRFQTEVMECSSKAKLLIILSTMQEKQKQMLIDVCCSSKEEEKGRKVAFASAACHHPSTSCLSPAA